MIKVRIFSNTAINEFEDNINSFIKDKKIIDIKYTNFIVKTGSGGYVSAVCDRALVIYEE